MKKVIRSIVLIPALTLGIGFASTTGSSPLFADPPVCQVFCVTTQCSHNSECTAAPNGRCNFACPQVGCCVYD